MNRSRAWFDAVAAETGYRAATLEKVVRLGELAAELARHPLLGTVLVLKGGTALNLCFGPPPRLSVDLDFNYVGAESREAMLKQRPLVERAIEAVARAERYRLQWSRAEHAGRKAYLGYTSSAASTNTLTPSPGLRPSRKSVNHVPGHSVNYVPGCSSSAQRWTVRLPAICTMFRGCRPL